MYYSFYQSECRSAKTLATAQEVPPIYLKYPFRLLAFEEAYATAPPNTERTTRTQR